jgi:hypothetical protein
MDILDIKVHLSDLSEIRAEPAAFGHLPSDAGALLAIEELISQWKNGTVFHLDVPPIHRLQGIEDAFELANLRRSERTNVQPAAIPEFDFGMRDIRRRVIVLERIEHC